MDLMMRRRMLMGMRKKSEIDYSLQYLTFKALEDSTFKFSKAGLSYSTDNGDTWTALDADTATPTVNAGNEIIFKGTMTPSSSSPYGIGTFSSTGKYNAMGNMMSLLYGDDFIGKKDLTGKTYTFYRLFRFNSGLIDTSNLILPATTLEGYCYKEMFSYCASLITTPKLPATILKTECYNSMFTYCTALTSAPKLPATDLKSNCYSNMFSDCTNLNYIKAMFTTTPSSTYTFNWVKGVSSTGTFVKNSAATWNVTGNNGVPSGWTVETADS